MYLTSILLRMTSERILLGSSYLTTPFVSSWADVNRSMLGHLLHYHYHSQCDTDLYSIGQSPNGCVWVMAGCCFVLVGLVLEKDLVGGGINGTLGQ